MDPMGDEARPYKIRIYPDAVLRERAVELDERRLAEEAPEIASRMIETMRQAPGAGLAANQVGLPLRLLVVAGEEPIVMANPQIDRRSGSEEEEEGCLSVPGVRGRVKRSAKLVVSFLDLEGKRYEAELGGFAARVVQHELDHIDGVLFLDRLGFAKKLAVRDRLRALEEGAAGQS